MTIKLYEQNNCINVHLTPTNEAIGTVRYCTFYTNIYTHPNNDQYKPDVTLSETHSSYLNMYKQYAAEERYISQRVHTMLNNDAQRGAKSVLLCGCILLLRLCRRMSERLPWCASYIWGGTGGKENRKESHWTRKERSDHSRVTQFAGRHTVYAVISARYNEPSQEQCTWRKGNWMGRGENPANADDRF